MKSVLAHAWQVLFKWHTRGKCLLSGTPLYKIGASAASAACGKERSFLGVPMDKPHDLTEQLWRWVGLANVCCSYSHGRILLVRLRACGESKDQITFSFSPQEFFLVPTGYR